MRSNHRGGSSGAALLLQPPPKSNMKNDSMTSVVMLMVSLFAVSYIAGRLWQDAEIRAQLISIDPSMGRQAHDSISVDETLRLIDCKEQQKKLMDAGLELAAAKSQGYKPINKTLLDGRKSVVVGIFTGYGGHSRRTASRKNWIPSGAALKELENDKGIIIRFVIGRSSNKGDMLDRQVDQESNETGDFLFLEDHVESDDNLTQKSRLFFSKAASTWDADFYVKMDDSVGLNIDMMASMLSSHRDKPRVYVGCMKSGMVVNDPNAQWYEPDWWKFGEQKSEYHRHAAGQVYGLSRSLALYISINSAYLKEYKNEDVAVGTWVLGLDTEHIDDRNLCRLLASLMTSEAVRASLWLKAKCPSNAFKKLTSDTDIKGLAMFCILEFGGSHLLGPRSVQAYKQTKQQSQSWMQMGPFEDAGWVE